MHLCENGIKAVYRKSISLCPQQKKVLEMLYKTEAFCRASDSEIIRFLIDAAAGTDAVKNLK